MTTPTIAKLNGMLSVEMIAVGDNPPSGRVVITVPDGRRFLMMQLRKNAYDNPPLISAAQEVITQNGGMVNQLKGILVHHLLVVKDPEMLLEAAGLKEPRETGIDGYRGRGYYR